MSNGRFVWYDLAAADMQTAQTFYEKLFGWTAQTFDGSVMPYAMLSNNGEGIGGIMPQNQPGAPSAWIPHMQVENLEKAKTYVTNSGGQVVVPPTTVPDMGRFMVVTDPMGSVVQFWTPNEKSPEPTPTTGRFAWTELHTSDVEKAKAFYGELGGWRFTTDPDPTGGEYITAWQNETRIAGITKQPGPSFWMSYVLVDDVDKTLETATNLGGKTMMPPLDIPNVGRMAVFTDPVGANLAIIKWAM